MRKYDLCEQRAAVLTGGTMDSWSEQWERVQLGQDRIRRIYDGIEDSSAEARYDLYSFFLNAYHLKDWLAKDHSASVSKRKVEKLVKATPVLALCGDLANRVKHSSLDPKRTPKIDLNTDVTSQSVTVDTGRGVVSHSWVIEGGGMTYDALDLTNEVVRAWEQFLRGRGLI